jgi:inhibitor of cysteine peptidase
MEQGCLDVRHMDGYRSKKERKTNMFKRILLMLFPIVLLFSMAGCTPEVQPTSKNAESQANQAGSTLQVYPAENQQLLPIISGKNISLQLDDTADGTTQQLKVGDVMAITLESNPSTGFAWFATSSNPEIVAQLGESQYQETQYSSGETLLGAAGTETLYYEAKGAGTATLTLDYKRGWEKSLAPEQTIIITVEVK